MIVRCSCGRFLAEVASVAPGDRFHCRDCNRSTTPAPVTSAATVASAVLR